jgi:hypothetical protein
LVPDHESRQRVLARNIVDAIFIERQAVKNVSADIDAWPALNVRINPAGWCDVTGCTTNMVVHPCYRDEAQQSRRNQLTPPW